MAHVFSEEQHASRAADPMADFEQHAKVMQALSDPERFCMLDLIRQGQGTVTVEKLCTLFHLSQPGISHHLRVLREAGLIDYKKAGAHHRYFFCQEALLALQRFLDQLVQQEGER